MGKEKAAKERSGEEAEKIKTEGKRQEAGEEGGDGSWPTL